MRTRRFIVVLTALLALAVGTAVATPTASHCASTSLCFCIANAQKTRHPVAAPRAAISTAPGTPASPHQREAWADLSVQYQRPPPPRS